MSAVNLTNVTVLNNPALFLSPFQFEISYECLVPLKDGNFRFLVSVNYGFCLSV
ncbi:putative histone chaperone ASF1 [Helianthus annuus]|nr:putative histone chaperone ASF1 [Helianthus annuus]